MPDLEVAEKEKLYVNCAEGWTVSDRVVNHEFRGIPYKAYDHSYFKHSNEIESRFRHLRMRSDAVALDVGASCGTWTIPMSFLCEKVYAFEPFPLFHTEIERNLSLNDIANVEIVPVMVGEWSLDACKLRCHAGRSSDGYIQYEGVLSYVSIDDFIRDLHIGRVSFIKIDVEGGELGVLRGAMDTIRRYLPNVLVEIHCMYGVSVQQVADFFAGASPHYNCTLMPQGDPSRVLTPCTVLGQNTIPSST